MIDCNFVGSGEKFGEDFGDGNTQALPYVIKNV